MLTGQVEDTNHSTKEQLTKEVQLLRDKVILLEEKDKSSTETLNMTQKRLTGIEDQLQKQDKYLKKVLATLTGAGAVKKATKKRSAYDSAMYDYKKARYKSAKTKLEALSTNKKIKGSKRARVLHNLGMISFMNKDDNSASAYFGKLFTEFPKSSYNANGLLYLAKSFKRMGQKDQAKQILDELIKRFPKSKRVKEAKALLKKL